MGWLLFLAIVASLIWYATIIAKETARKKEEARVNYQSFLAELKKNPTNADLKEATLARGRFYSNLIRDKRGNTIFDEMALMNDISAACAGASSSLPRSASFQVDLESRLRTLHGLRQKGLIDEAEFAKRKSELIAQI